MHPLTRQQESIHVLYLSIEAMWIARVIHDALDVALEDFGNSETSLTKDRLKALRINRDVFERLGIYGCGAGRVSPWSVNWSATSRVELIRQVGVHWRAFIDASFGTSVSMKLIRTLTEDEIRLLEQIQIFGRTLQINGAAILHDMNQQLTALSLRQSSLLASRCANYLGTVQVNDWH